MKPAYINLWKQTRHVEACPYGIMSYNEETGKITMFRDSYQEKLWLAGKL